MQSPIPATRRYEAPPAAGSRSIPPPLLEGRLTRQAFLGPPPVTTPAEEYSRLQPLLDSPFLNLKLYVSPNAVTPPEPHPSIPLPSAVHTLLFLEDLVPASRAPVSKKLFLVQLCRCFQSHLETYAVYELSCNEEWGA
ncbi:hypothetical protein KSP40_PGU010914 [Platanthera guangdongensis]|uniref:Uncharacterized protein n=1 Tax=Platanthera guangdongensis TaxID=2320717 RepID=A0ABR2MIT7_9ASPA